MSNRKIAHHYAKGIARSLDKGGKWVSDISNVPILERKMVKKIYGLYFDSVHTNGTIITCTKGEQDEAI